MLNLKSASRPNESILFFSSLLMARPAQALPKPRQHQRARHTNCVLSTLFTGTNPFSTPWTSRRRSWWRTSWTQSKLRRFSNSFIWFRNPSCGDLLALLHRSDLVSQVLQQPGIQQDKKILRHPLFDFIWFQVLCFTAQSLDRKSDPVRGNSFV